jgi:NAD(P)-dependent dehydrogenase (short-subunit alcohol dehydrogenase family)
MSMSSVQDPGSLAPPDRTVTVFGASGHTGRFVVAELARRGWGAILAGRDPVKLRTLCAAYPATEVRIASVDDPSSLDRALDGAAAVLNCAGPFADTSVAVIEAALRARIHYLDVTAEQVIALGTFERFAERARSAGIVIAPAMAFYGGLSDLLVTAALRDWRAADEVTVAYALDSWQPTRGTRLTGQRAGQRLIYASGQWQQPPDPPVTARWRFPCPFGAQDVVALPMIDAAMIARHIRTPDIRVYMNLAPLAQLRDPSTPPPEAADDRGRSAQTFVVDVVARRGREHRRAFASGRDIYAVTAPILVEATERILDGRVRTLGVVSAGEAFDAEAMLGALAPEHLAFALE